MKAPHYITVGFLTCLLMVLGAMAWLTATAHRLDRAEAEARGHLADARWQEVEAHRKTAWEENVHLALWRLDSALSPLIAQESARPFFTYSPSFPVNRAYEMLGGRSSTEATIQPPLLPSRSSNIVAHFQFEPDGRLTSPQVPARSNRGVAPAEEISEASIERAEQGLVRLASITDRDRLLDRLPAHGREPVLAMVSPLAQSPSERAFSNRGRMAELANNGRGAVEFNERTQAVTAQLPALANNFAALNGLNMAPDLDTTNVSGMVMVPLWVDGELLFARRVMVDARDYVQGCLLNWPALKTSLLEMIEDLLPDADLQPAGRDGPRNAARLLAAIPVRLVPGDMSPAGLPQRLPMERRAWGLSPIEMSLGAAWFCVLLAATAVAVLLVGLMRLASRRVKFVTAVTHELRTPLTTFQMYTEMLNAGIVSDDSQRKQYVETLHSEATRLTHLVENVLAYARLEQGRASGRFEVVGLDQLVGAMRERLENRAQRSGMELVVENSGQSADTMIRANRTAVEQILFNLVDNACKYAATGSDKRIHLTLSADAASGRITVRDHGCGIPRKNMRAPFRSFSKSAYEAAHSAPGVGLGLSLSRRLARDMGGDLRLDRTTGHDGAAFVLTLPVAR